MVEPGLKKPASYHCCDSPSNDYEGFDYSTLDLAPLRYENLMIHGLRVCPGLPVASRYHGASPRAPSVAQIGMNTLNLLVRSRRARLVQQWLELVGLYKWWFLKP